MTGKNNMRNRALEKRRQSVQSCIVLEYRTLVKKERDYSDLSGNTSWKLQLSGREGENKGGGKAVLAR